MDLDEIKSENEVEDKPCKIFVNGRSPDNYEELFDESPDLFEKQERANEMQFDSQLPPTYCKLNKLSH